MLINPEIILRELDRRKDYHERHSADRKAKDDAWFAEYKKDLAAYEAMPWWRKLFACDPIVRMGLKIMMPIYDGASFEHEHKNLYALCRYASESGQHVDVPFEYSYLLP